MIVVVSHFSKDVWFLDEDGSRPSTKAGAWEPGVGGTQEPRVIVAPNPLGSPSYRLHLFEIVREDGNAAFAAAMIFHLFCLFAQN